MDLSKYFVEFLLFSCHIEPSTKALIKRKRKFYDLRLGQLSTQYILHLQYCTNEFHMSSILGAKMKKAHDLVDKKAKAFLMSRIDFWFWKVCTIQSMKHELALRYRINKTVVGLRLSSAQVWSHARGVELSLQKCGFVFHLIFDAFLVFNILLRSVDDSNLHLPRINFSKTSFSSRYNNPKNTKSKSSPRKRFLLNT